MQDFKKLNNITGWIVFAISLVIYVLTREPTASFWDCGEFIACSYKLEVPHPPGAPLFLLIGRLFSMLAFGNVEKVALWVNTFSAFSSAFTILFLFWTITLLARKIIKPSPETNSYSLSQTITILGSGIVGSFACAVCDSFWFNAVEAEVYSTSYFFTAVTFWAMLKWEVAVDEGDTHADRWIILIAYLIGLSVGIHLLSLLAVPALGFIYYFKKKEYSLKGLLITFVISGVILGVIQFGVIQLLPTFALKTDIFFVNDLGMPFGSGALFFTVVGLFILIYGIRHSIRKNKYVLNLSLICLVFILLGNASSALVVIRSQANPPIDENNPEDILSFLSYLKREQYGDRPLFKGPNYNSTGNGLDDLRPVDYDYNSGEMRYIKSGNKYEEEGRVGVPIYRKEVLFPRMYSTQANHINTYKEYKKNIPFFLQYQVGHMFMRYFLWNFVGREHDIQEADWISGFNFGVKDVLPDDLLHNRARNTYFFLPFLLGLWGLFYHYQKHRRDTFIVAVLFFMTGFAIIIYLNQTPDQPRERDYSYAGAFYAFTIWIGLGVMAVVDSLNKYLKNKTLVSAGSSALCLLLVPGIMIANNWDDHSRAGRYVCPDSARNLLESCAPNAILFTNGDNDTFPLWYIQEVEGVRTDVRIVNLSLLNTDWYVYQLKHQWSNKSSPLPISIKDEDFMGERNQLKPFKTGIVEIPVDTNYAVNQGIVAPEMKHNIESPMRWSVRARDANKQGEGYLERKDIVILDLLKTNKWERPIYFAITIPNSSFLGLEPYFQLEGLAYRVIPVKSKNPKGEDRVAEDIMFNNMMKKFRFTGLNDEHVYFEDNTRRMVSNFRNNFMRLAFAYAEKGEKEKTDSLLRYSMRAMPDKTLPMDTYGFIMMSELYDQLGDSTRSDEMLAKGSARGLEYLKYYYSDYGKEENPTDKKRNLDGMNYIFQVMLQRGKMDKAEALANDLQRYTKETQYMEAIKYFRNLNAMKDSLKLTLPVNKP